MKERDLYNTVLYVTSLGYSVLFTPDTKSETMCISLTFTLNGKMSYRVIDNFGFNSESTVITILIDLVADINRL